MELQFNTPLAVLNLEKLTVNLEEMVELARENNVCLRPMIKTHKSSDLARLQLESDLVSGLTVATLDEAEVMLEAGVEDIFIAYQLIGRPRLERLMGLASRGRISVAVDSLAGAEQLNRLLKEYNLQLEYLIEINTGLNRCGVKPGESAVDLAREITDSCPKLKLKGIFTHAGQVYGAAGPEQVQKVGELEGRLIGETALLFKQAGFPLQIVSVGSTPTVRYSAAHPEVNEIRPGNYVFYDNIQVGLGVVPPSRCSLSIFSTVISSFPEEGRAVIDSGSKTLALDQGAHGNQLVEGFGLVLIDGEVSKEVIIDHLSEEHGFLKILNSDINLKVGDLIEIIPNHACTAVNNFNALATYREGQFAGLIKIEARRILQ